MFFYLFIIFYHYKITNDYNSFKTKKIYNYHEPSISVGHKELKVGKNQQHSHVCQPKLGGKSLHKCNNLYRSMCLNMKGPYLFYDYFYLLYLNLCKKKTLLFGPFVGFQMVIITIFVSEFMLPEQRLC